MAVLWRVCWRTSQRMDCQVLRGGAASNVGGIHVWISKLHMGSWLLWARFTSHPSTRRGRRGKESLLRVSIWIWPSSTHWPCCTMHVKITQYMLPWWHNALRSLNVPLLHHSTLYATLTKSVVETFCGIVMDASFRRAMFSKHCWNCVLWWLMCYPLVVFFFGWRKTTPNRILKFKQHEQFYIHCFPAGQSNLPKVIYWSIKEYGIEALGLEQNWFLLSACRSSIVRRLPGKMSEFFKMCLLQFYCPVDLRLGAQLQLHGQSDRAMIFCRVGVLLGDEGALKEVLEMKGCSRKQTLLFM